jgi:hypothetical protein
VRIARLAVGSSAQPVVALERDGALYDVAELERIFDTRFSPERMPGASDFHTRVIALGCAGLDALDDRLRSGDRPTAARALPGTFVWLAPCDTDRASFIQLAPLEEPSNEPLHRRGDARGLLGHDVVVPIPPGAAEATYELGVAAILGESVEGASPEQAERSILGYVILNAWAGSELERNPGWLSCPVPMQLGPVLVTKDDLGDVGALRAQVRIDGVVVTSTSLGCVNNGLSSAMAWVSRWTELRAGDVIGRGCGLGGRGAMPYGGVAELMAERLGKLAGRPLRRTS